MTQLWPHQQTLFGEIRAGYRSYQSIVAQSATGSGKTQIGAHAVKLATAKENEVIWLAHRRELLEGTSNTFNQAGIAHSLLMGGTHYNPRLRSTIASVGMLANRLESIRPPKLLIVDECFPAGTLVDGKPIEQIEAGDLVTSFNHELGQTEPRPVVFPMKRGYDGDWYRIESSDGRSFVCTENHPVFVIGVGYVAAKCLREHVGCEIVTHDRVPSLPITNYQKTTGWPRQDEVLQSPLRGRLHESGFCQSTDGRVELLQLRRESYLHQPEEVHGCEETGASVLQRYLQEAVSPQAILGNDAGHEPEIQGRYRSEDARAKSNGGPQEHRNHGVQDEGTDFLGQGWERPADQTATNSPRANRPSYGIPNIAEGRTRAFRVRAEELQGGPGSAGGKACDRGGRQDSQAQEVAVPRQAEDGYLGISRLASVEIYERGSRCRPNWVPGSDTVYNLHVAGNNNYFANGILVHNCHHSTATSYDKIIRWVEAHGGKALGLTATPWRLSGEGLDNHYQHMVQGPPVAWLIANGYLSDYRAYAPSAPDLTGIHTLAGDYVKNEIDQVMQGKAIVADCVSQWRRYAPGKRTIGFAVSVEHSQMMVEEFRKAGIAAAHIDAGTAPPVRRQHILNFATGHLQVLWNCDLFSEGFDLSAIAGRDVPIECAIQARPTKSLTLHLQQVGRALRRKPYPAILLDLCGNLARLGLPDHPHEWTLQGRPKKGRGGKGEEPAPLVRKCSGCDVQIPMVLPSCPHCGTVVPSGGGGRKVEEVAGELREVDREQAKRERLREQSGAKSLEELIELGKAKGYKNPEAWASHVFTARLQKQNRG